MPRIVFVADGGRIIGSGHVMRSLALAAPFASGGWQVAFAVGAEAAQTLPLLTRSDYQVAVLPELEADEPAALAREWPDGADVLVVDHYQRGHALEQACRPWAKRIAVIDDLADRRHDADVLADASNSAEAYRQLVPSQCAVLSGPRY